MWQWAKLMGVVADYDLEVTPMMIHIVSLGGGGEGLHCRSLPTLGSIPGAKHVFHFPRSVRGGQVRGSRQSNHARGLYSYLLGKL